MADVGGIAGDRLKSFIERIERLDEERRAIVEDIKEVFAEAKGTGFDTKIMRQILKIRGMDQSDLDEQETLLDVYLRALGMRPDFDDEPAERAPRADADEGRAEPEPTVADLAGAIGAIAAAGNVDAQAVVAAAKAGPEVMAATARAILDRDDRAASEIAGAPTPAEPEADVSPSRRICTASALYRAEQSGREAHALGTRVSEPPEGLSAAELAAWDRGWCEAAKEAREQVREAAE